MSPERYRHCRETGAQLTPEEFAAGWDYCHEWDGLLIGPGWPEMKCCTCKDAAEETT